MLGPAIEPLEVIGGVVQVHPPVEAEPAQIALDRVDIFLVLAGRVGVVEAQVAAPAELLGHAEVQADRLGMTDMEIAVGLGWKPGYDLANPPLGEVGRNDVADKVVRRRSRCFTRHHDPRNLAGSLRIEPPEAQAERR